MDRRRFLTALAGVVAAGKAAPALLAKLGAPAPSAWGDWPPGLLDVSVSTSLHGLSGSVVPQWSSAVSAGPPLDWAMIRRTDAHIRAVRPMRLSFAAWERRVLG